MPISDKEKKLSDKGIAKRRDEVLLRMLKTPPKPHEEMKGKGKAAKTEKPSKK